MRKSDVVHGNRGVRGYRPAAAGRGTGRSAARRAVLQGGPRAMRARWRAVYWGVSLCGPMVIADAATGTIATSEPAPAGDRPRALGFVNAPVQWGGITWSAYVWEMIPKDRGERGRLFMHELFHCIQRRLGWGAMARLPAPAKTAISIRWRAATGCGSSGGPWRGRLAPLVRRARPPLRTRWRFVRRGTSVSPARRTREHIVDINEGIATYTQYVTGSDECAGRDPERDGHPGGLGGGHIFRAGRSRTRLELVMGCCSTRCLQAGTGRSQRRAILASCSRPRLA